MEKSSQILSEITVYMKYAKYLPEENRRETWEELVTRNKEMHQKTYPKLKEEIEENQKSAIISLFFHIKTLRRTYHILHFEEKFKKFFEIGKPLIHIRIWIYISYMVM